MKCGSIEMDGYAFCLGLSALKLSYQTRPNLRSQILPVIYLIQGAAFRPTYDRRDADQPVPFSLNIRTLSELIDMYHAREATNRLDKLYALLGMSTENPNELNLVPNYEKPWGDVFRTFIELSISSQLSVKTWDDVEVAIIESKGLFLGKVTSLAESNFTADGRQRVEITWITDEKSHLTFQPSAKPIQVGDGICLLEGATRPTIIRPCNGFLVIIMSAVPAPQTDELVSREWTGWMTIFSIDLLLIWDWDAEPGKASGKDYESFINNRVVLNCRRKECQCQHHFHKAVRLANLGLYLSHLGRYREAEENILKAMEIYEIVMGLGCVDDPDHSRYFGTEANEKAPKVLNSWQDEANDEGKVIEVKDQENNQAQPTWAVSDGLEAFARPLLSAESNKQKPLLWAAKRGHMAVMRLLLENGAKAERDDEDHRTPPSGDALCWAAEADHKATVHFLLQNGAEVEGTDDWHRTPLLLAASKGNEAIVQLLLDNGAEIEATDDWHQTPLLLAAAGGHKAIVRLLLDNGAKTEATDNWHQTSLLLAAEKGHATIVQLLLDNGAEIEATNIFQRTPLSWAASKGHEAVVQLLLDSGAKFEVTDSWHWTPVSRAAEKGHEAIVRLLLNSGAAIEATDDWGRTPLSRAAEKGHEAVVQLLLDNGAKTEAKDKYNQTALLLAAEKGHEMVVQLLLNSGANTEAINNWQWTPLARAAEKGYGKIVQLLLSKKANIEAVDMFSRTPLSWAASKGHEAVIQLLLDNGANVGARDKDNQTPLSRAIKNGHEAVVQLLLNSGAESEARNE